VLLGVRQCAKIRCDGWSRLLSLAPVTDLHTERLILHPIDTAEAERIAGRATRPR
jgi:hypothetical protein